MNPIALLIFLLLLSACGGGGGGGASGEAVDNSRSPTPPPVPIPVPRFSCTQGSEGAPEDKALSCNDRTNVLYSSDNQLLCRIDTIGGLSVLTCLESGQTMLTQRCFQGSDSDSCPDEIAFSCEANSLSTSDNLILSCDDDTAVSMDISNDELCRIDLGNGTGFCLSENTLGELPTVWSGYSRSIIGIGENVPLHAPIWGPSGTVFSYSATPAEVCSVHPETGELFIEGLGECDIALTISFNEMSKVIEKTVQGRFFQYTAWNGYTASSMDFGATPPTFIGPQYAPYGADFQYSSENTDVCTVDSGTGEIAAPTQAGDCIITMMSTADNYADREISFTLRVDPLSLPALTWTDPYGAGPFDVSTTVSAPNSGALTGQGSLSVGLENYRSTTPTICTVDETTGVPTLLINGDCTIEVDASIPGYTPQTFSTTLTVALATMSLTWTSPIPSLGNTDSVQPDEPSGIPGTAVVASLVYSSETPLTCSVDPATGEITPIINGTCTAVLTVTFPGYEPGVVKITVEIDEPQSTQWTGYSSNSTPFSKETLTLDAPTGEPSGATLAYSSLTTDICTVDSDRVLTLVDAGDCRIRLISSHEDYGDKLIDFPLTVTPLTFPMLEWGTLYGSGPFDVESTGLAPTLSNLGQVPSEVDLILRGVESTSLDICTTDDDGNLTLLRDGSCVLTVTVGAKGYNDGTPVMGTVEVGLADMTLTWDGYDDDDDTITFGDAAPVLEAPSFTTATVTPHTFSYTSGDTSICTVDEEGALTILRNGSCEITLMVSALGYNDATVTSTQTIEPRTITGVVWNGYDAERVGVGDSVRTTPPSGIPEGAVVSYSGNDGSICTVDAEGTVTGQSRPWDCTVTLRVVQVGYQDLTLTDSLQVRDSQNLAWAGYSSSAMIFGETSPTLVDPTDVDDATVTYASLTTGVCTVDDTSGELTIVNHGLCTILLSGVKEDLGRKEIPFELTINPATMTDFSWEGYDADTVVFPNAPNLEEPTGAASGATLTYTSQTEEICTVDSTTGELTAVDDGVCTIELTATAVGYTSVSLSSSITLETAGAIGFVWTGYSSGNVVFGITPPSLNPPAQAPSGAVFRYSSTPSRVCLVNPDDGSLTLSGVGSCTVTATGSAPGYEAGDETFDLTITPSAMSDLIWAGYSANVVEFGDSTLTLVPPEGVPWGATFDYVSSAPDICAVDPASGELHLLNNGSCTITLTVSARNYSDTTVSANLTINPRNMDSLVWSGYAFASISFGDSPPSHIPPTGGPENATFEYTSSDENVCTVDSATGELTILNHGDCVINLTASAAGYNDGNISATVVVNEGLMAGVVWNGYNSDVAIFPSAPGFLPPTGIPGGATTNYTSSDENICTVDSATGALTLVDQGICTLTLTVSLSGYADVVISFRLTIQPLEMASLTWESYPSSTLIRGSFAYPIGFSGEPAGVSYSYSTSTPDICSVEEDGDLWGRDLGTCRVAVTARAHGYNDKTLEGDVAVVRGGLAVGAYRSCVLLSDGQIKCWGFGLYGTLGQGNRNHVGDSTDEMGTNLMSVDLGANLKAKFMAAVKTGGHSCAILDDNQVKCWGANSNGQLGQGHTDNIGDDPQEMGDNLAYTDLGSSRTAKAVSLGKNFSCAILDDDQVKCWGRNNQGQLGQNHSDDRGDASGEMGDNLAYTNLGTQRTPKDIRAGVDHACALLDDNTIKCWGGNGYGQLGQGHTNAIGNNADEMENLNPIDVGDSRTVKRVAAGGFYSCGILDNNDLVCWGSNLHNQLGIDRDSNNRNIGDASGEMGSSLVATHLVSRDAADIRLGVDSTCVIRKSGELSCWGDNAHGELGLEHVQGKGGASTQSADIRVNLGRNYKARMVQIGISHACALLDNDQLKCWGQNNYGQLGQEDTTTRGDEVGEMGDNLGRVNLVRDMVDLVWRGYTSNTVDYLDVVPSLILPTGLPSGAMVSYFTTTTNICVVDSDGNLTVVRDGTCRVTLTARAPGYRTGERTFVLTARPINMDDLTWTGYASDSVNYGDTAPLISAPTDMPLDAILSYSTTTLGICVVDQTSGVLRIVANGTCSVILSVSAPGYHTTNLTRTVTVNPGVINLVWGGYSSDNITFGDSLSLDTPRVVPSGATLTYTSSTTNVCSVDGSSGILTQESDGVCTVRVTASATGYSDAVIDRNITVGKRRITGLNWDGYAVRNNTAIFPNAPVLVSPTGTLRNATVEYTSLTAPVCTVNSGTGALSLVGTGLCSIQITVRVATYYDVSEQVDITIDPGAINLAWTGYSSGRISFGDPLLLIDPTVTPRDATLTYTSSDTNVCSVDGPGNVTQVNIGVCRITLAAQRTGYRDKSVSASVVISKGRISNLLWNGYANNNTGVFPNAPALISPTRVPSGTTFEYTSLTTVICTVDPTTGALTLVNVGSCVVQLTARASGYYDRVEVAVVTVSPGPINFVWAGYSPETITFTESVSLNDPTRAPAGTVFSYSTSTTDVCEVDSVSGALTIVDSGSCVVTVSARLTGYSSVSLDAIVSINPKETSLIWAGYSPDTINFGETLTLSDPVVNPADATLYYTSDTPTVCTVSRSRGTVTQEDHGTCTITLTTNRTGYVDGVRTFSITINPKEMTALAWTGYSSSALIRGPLVYPDALTGAPAGVNYSYSTTTPNICSVYNDGDLRGLDLGTCSVSVVASSPGYNNKTLSANATVTRGGAGVGFFSSCALLSNGQINCWGQNTADDPLGLGHSTGHIGDGANEMGTHLPSIDLGDGLKSKLLAVGGRHRCGIFGNGRVKCWGSNYGGQLGQGHTGNLGDAPNEMGDDLPFVDLGTGRSAKSLSLGSVFSCALLDNNGVKCWGYNDEGQLGQGNTQNKGDDSGEMGDSLPNINLGVGRFAKDISAGDDHVCALLDNNKIKCWGDNEYGQLGQGFGGYSSRIGAGANDMENLEAVDLGIGRTAKQVAAGQEYTCAILDNNDLACWGSNGRNRLGIDYDSTNPNIGDASNEMGNNLRTTHLVSQDAVYVTLGRSTCVIKKNGALYCWGDNRHGQLGLGDTASKGNAATQATDVEVDLGTGRSAKTAHIRGTHACTLLDNDDIKCWGRNNYGQLGQGDTTTRGDGSGEMGDSLSAVSLVPEMLGLVWSGYSRIKNDNEDTITFTAPTGVLKGANLAYTTTTSAVCTVNSSTGVVTMTDANGICTVTLTATLTGYRNKVITRSVPAYMSGVQWSGYSPNPVSWARTSHTSRPADPTGLPAGAAKTYSLRSGNTSYCQLHSSTGNIWLSRNRALGVCKVRLTIKASGYLDRIFDETVFFNN